MIDERGNEQVWVKVDSCEPAFVLENLRKCVDRSRVRAEAWKSRLDDETGAY
jgi:hypothetical protein